MEEAQRRFAAGAEGDRSKRDSADGDGEKSEFDAKYRRNSLYWLGFSLVAMVGYALSGEIASYIDDDDDYEMDEEEDEEEDGYEDFDD